MTVNDELDAVVAHEHKFTWWSLNGPYGHPQGWVCSCGAVRDDTCPCCAKDISEFVMRVEAGGARDEG